MGLVGGKDPQPRQQVAAVGRAQVRAASARFGVNGVNVSRRPGEDVFAGEEQCLEIRLGASGGEDSVAAGEAEVAAGPVDEAAFHEGGDLGLVVGVDRSVDGREHRFGGDGGHASVA